MVEKGRLRGNDGFGLERNNWQWHRNVKGQTSKCKRLTLQTLHFQKTSVSISFFIFFLTDILNYTIFYPIK